MKNKESVIGLIEAIDSAMLFSPVKIYYNKKCIWDDSLSIDEGWISMQDAMKRFCDTYKDWEQITVTAVKIDIVEWHHSVIRIKGKIKRRTTYETL